MSAQLLDGKLMSDELRVRIAERVAALKEKGVHPGLAVILVGEDPASQIYVRNKEKGCEQVGMHSVAIRLPENTTQEELEGHIRALNADASIHGILVQLPLPKHLDEAAALAVIVPEKDVDGFHVQNAGKLLNGLEGVIACTPKDALEMIRRTGVNLSGKEAVVVGRSNIVGKPMAMLLL
ncbi:MAG: bifunctional 5,10-methylene-tetrahydrofolate dehydrogenase/5,10-methylene-tetrahydrofolate cyclohydrolase, partial [Oscillospiraceae bacterium]|nr:bifunctional 5,10-methylene-tetrahydrofolate dehydrogenase/5,10-methylene-tetrahydrofolate cyclohydrolase [Oscillospiraceae bacterium]